MRTLFKKSLRDLFVMKSQSLTIALLIGVGVALLVSSWSAYNSLSIAQSSFYAQSQFADLFGSAKKAPLSLLSSFQNLPGVELIAQRVETTALLHVPDMKEPSLGQFISLPPQDEETLNKVYVKSGRYPESSNQNEVLVNQAFSEALDLKVGNEVSALFNGKIHHFKIVGVGTSPDYIYALNPSAPLPDNRHFGVFWVPERRLRSLTNMDGSFTNLSFKLSEDADSNYLKSEVDRLLKPYGGLNSYTKDKQLSNMFVSDELAQQRISAIVLPGIFLSVSAFLIHIIFSRLIQLQRRQIATLKACGYSNFSVGLHFAMVVLLIGAVGTLIGLLGGVWIGQWNTEMYARFFNFPDFQFVLNWQSILISISIGLCAGLVGASSSLLSVIKLTPAQAMQPPTPPQFKAFWFEALFGIKNLRTTSRITLRNLFQRPLRLLFSEIGIGLGIAIMIMALFWKDSVYFIIDSTFYKSDRSHLQVGFTQPLGKKAIEELEHLGGVIEVEPYHSTAVRIRHLQLKKEVALTGLKTAEGMKRLSDLKGKRVELPEDGLLLSKALGDRWGLKVGDSLLVETITGPAKSWQLPIGGFVDDLIGSAAYIQIAHLWKLLDEEESYTHASLYTDSPQNQDLYIELKNHPLISSVNIKNILLESFKTNMAQMILIFTYILISFAMLIAIGVIYNNSRVNLSERAWELTSLRILGFNKSSVFILFFGELAIQLLVAIPLGLIFGYTLSFLSTKMIHTDVFVFPFIIEKATYSLSILVMLFGFALSGIVIHRQLGRLSLADALKERE